MSGEITRAILTQQCGSRKYKAYSTEFIMAANPTVPSNLSSQIEITNNTFFLWTGIAVYQIGGNETPPGRLFNLSLRRVSDGRAFQNAPVLSHAFTSNSLALPSDNPMGDYALFDGDDVVGVTLGLLYPQTVAVTVTVVLSGIEYVK